jgi:hypothetical protein
VRTSCLRLPTQPFRQCPFDPISGSTRRFGHAEREVGGDYEHTHLRRGAVSVRPFLHSVVPCNVTSNSCDKYVSCHAGHLRLVDAASFSNLDDHHVHYQLVLGCPRAARYAHQAPIPLILLRLSQGCCTRTLKSSSLVWTMPERLSVPSTRARHAGHLTIMITDPFAHAQE